MPGEIIYTNPTNISLIDQGTSTGLSLHPPANVEDVTANVGPRTGFSSTPEGAQTEDAWDYFRDVIEKEFYNLEQAFELTASSTLDVGVTLDLTEVAAGSSVEIGALPFVALAGAILAGEYAFGWLIKKVGQLFPNPSLFGWHPLGFIQHGLINMGNGFEGSARGLSKYIVHAIEVPIKQVLGVFQRLGNALFGAHNKSRTIVQTRIPAAVDSAVAQARVYTDASVATLQADQEAALSKVYDDTAAAIQAGKLDAADGVTSTLETVQASIMERIGNDQATLEAITAALAQQTSSAVAAGVAAAEETTDQGLIAQALTLAAATAALETQVKAHQATIATREAQITTAEGLIANATGTDAATEAAIKYQEGLVTTYKSDIETNIRAIETLESEITAKSTTLGQIHTIQQLRTTQNTSHELVAATAIATVVATIAKTVYNLKTQVDQCMVDRCNPSGPHGLKTELLALLSALTAAGEIAFIAEAVRDPVGTADTLAPTLDAVDAAAVSALDALLSL